MKISIPLPALLRKRGVALILVVSVLSLMTILMLAMFSATDNEFKSTQGYVAAQDARRLGDEAVNLTIAQLQQASLPLVGNVTRVITATQPGEVRSYSTDGTFLSAYKMYSASQMQVTGGVETDLLKADIPPNDWDSHDNQNRWVDLNEPIIRAAVNGTSSAAEIYFPIVDPRAYLTSATQIPNTPANQVNVEGFSYTDTPPDVGTNASDGVVAGTTGRINGIVLPAGGAPDSAVSNSQRLPMPVMWLYLLQDGTMGTLDASNKFQRSGAGGGAVSATNPIVGRVAFWTDDETGKINVNTASEPTYWGTPRFFHEREHGWSQMPPTAKEYQRFPGHPATVALSSVFYPDVPGINSFDLFGQKDPLLTQNINKMQRIYDIVPKIARGGSVCGTKVFVQDDEAGFSLASQVNVAASVTERLYASLDEVLFSPDMSGNVRKLNDEWVPKDVTSAATPIIDKTIYGRDLRQTLERSRFFLTASSRGPDFNILGLPKVTMWPVSYYNDNDHRTVYDKLIAFCSTFKGSGDNTYFFQRARAHDANYDISITRNAQLMTYLKSLVNSTMPGTSNTSSNSHGSLGDKYGQDNMNTILVQIFDYIRSTNLYDDILSNKNVQTSTTGLSETQVYTNAPAEFYTYTNPLRFNVRSTDQGGNAVTPRTVSDDGWPGHGTVSPSIWNVGSAKYRGMARMFTISEIGLHFICTADGGTGDPVKDHSYVEPTSGVASGGRGCERIDFNQTNTYVNEGQSNAYSYLPPSADNKAYWWSNYPPKPLRDQYGTKVSKYRSPTTDNPNVHPGYDPANWNCTLAAGTPLAKNQKRIQALLDFEIFCPAEGWTLLNPEWTIVLDGSYVSAITVNGNSIWSTSRNVVLKSNKNLFSANTNMGRSGGAVDPVGIYSGRRSNGLGDMPKDPGYDSSAQTNVHAALDNCDLASNFFTVTGNANGQSTMALRFPGSQGMSISLYDTHNWQTATPIQTFTVNFAAGGTTITTVTPELVTTSTNKRTYVSGGVVHTQRCVDAPRWWSFSYGGCLGRYQRNGIITPTNIDSWGYAAPTPEGSLTQRLGGRFRLENDSTSVQSSPGPVYTALQRANVNTNTGVPASAALIYALPTGITGVNDPDTGLKYDKEYGADVVRSIIPALGDYRVVASRYNVPATMWTPHRLWTATDPNTGTFYYQAHNFCAHNALDAGCDTNLATNSRPNKPQFVRAYPNNNATLLNMSTRMPDIPQDPTSGNTPALDALNSFLDFDNGPGDSRDGAYCNKPDEGNFSALNYQFSGVGEKTFRNGYYYTTYEMEPDKTANDSYFTPNRLVSSPVMFGSLVTSVFVPPVGFTLSGYDLANSGRPWQTLLFRPHVTPTQAGAAAVAQYTGTTTPVGGGMSVHPGAQNPPDHYLLDLFNMPVVEPYAISEPLSTAGKINLNYQIVPFTYIRRATAVYAAMKGELIRAVSISDNGNSASTTTTAYSYKNGASLPAGQTFPPLAFYTETGSSVAANNGHYWHRRVDPLETTKQLDERFLMNTSNLPKRQGLLRSASQICELHMIPSNYMFDPASGRYTAPSSIFTMPASSAQTREQNMQRFWSVHALTGDNTREEIYSRLYPKFTTRSNTFRVHVRAQALKKTRATAAETFDVNNGDKVLSEYRGSYLLERYIDPNDATNILPNYGASSNPLSLPSLETYYRFHVLEVKRFAP